MAAKNKQKSKARILKDIFTQLIPVIQKQGFVEKPFVNSEFGWHPGIGYMYAFARMDGKILELLDVIIYTDKSYVQVHYTIVDVSPAPNDISEIKKGDKFALRTMTDMINTECFPEIFYVQNIFQRIFLSLSYYKLKFRISEWGRRRQEQKLFERMKSDFERIDKAKKNWYKRHTPIVVDWNGDPISSNSDKP